MLESEYVHAHCTDTKMNKLWAGGRHGMPPPLSSSSHVGAEAPLAAEQAMYSSFSRPTRFHAHRCSRLTRQRGGEQSGLVTLTLKVVS